VLSAVTLTPDRGAYLEEQVALNRDDYYAGRGSRLVPGSAAERRSAFLTDRARPKHDRSSRREVEALELDR
jgi:hypothetical protein